MKRRRAIVALGAIGLGGGAYFGNRWNLFDFRTDLDFLNSRVQLLGQLVDVIIPKTNTPGALECGVHHFVLMMVKEATDKRTQINFVEGLRKLERYVEKEFDAPFTQLNKTQKENCLRYFESHGKPLPGLIGKAKNRFLGKSFFVRLKELTTMGYCTSKPGATEALAYVSVPTQYIACADLSDYPKSWATE